MLVCTDNFDMPAPPGGAVRRLSAKGLNLHPFSLGPTQTNCYLIGDEESETAVVIDPSWEGETIYRTAEGQGLRIQAIWLTHAHFDHFGGAAAIDEASEIPVPVALHPADQTLWRMQGGAPYFGVRGFDPGPEPTIDLEHGMELRFGGHTFQVRHTPGHTPGHVIFVAEALRWVFCGDLIFKGSVGRTDLPAGDYNQLIRSIKEEILVLPDEFRLYSGHGPETTVGQERRANPFVNAL